MTVYEINFAKSHICILYSVTQILRFHLGLFVPTYLDLAFQYTLPEKQRPWHPMKQPREVDLKKADKSKAKGKRVTKKSLDGAEVFVEEKDFLISMLCESISSR